MDSDVWAEVAAVLARGQELMRAGDDPLSDDRRVSWELGCLQLDALVLAGGDVAEVASPPDTVHGCVAAAAAVVAGMNDWSVTSDSEATVIRLSDLVARLA